MNPLEHITGSRSRAEIFRLLFEQAGVELYLRELHRRSGLSLRPVQLELEKLQALGLVIVRKDGNRLYYSANTEHPLFPELRSMVEKTTGVAKILRDVLSDPEIQVAFIFGSVASGDARPGSDLDLFVIGELGLRKLTRLLSGVSERIAREINPHVVSAREFVQRRAKADHFLTNVLESKKIFVIGGENDLKRLGEQ